MIFVILVPAVQDDGVRGLRGGPGYARHEEWVNICRTEVVPVAEQGAN